MSEHEDTEAGIDLRATRKPRTVSKELVRTVAPALAASVLIAALGFGLHGLIGLRGSLADRLSLVADLVSPHAITAFDARDPQMGRNVLAGLASDASIRLACLYAETADGLETFATFSRSEQAQPMCEKPGASMTGWSRIALNRPIVRDGKRLGALYVESDTQALTVALTQMIWVGVCVLLGSVVVGYLAQLQLRRRIALPIAQLVDVSIRTTQSDFSVSIDLDCPAELGTIADSMRRAADRVSELIRRDRIQSAEILSSIEALDQIGQRIAAGSKQQEAAIEETGAATGRTIDSIAVIGENVEALSQEASETSMAVGQMDTSASKVIGQMEDVLNSIDTTASSILQATASIASISDCLATLQSASDSTMDSLCAFRVSGESVREIAFKNRALSERTAEEALGGLKAVSESIQGMDEIQQSFAEVEWAVGGLSEQLVSIDDIVAVIDGVADESSLLALNAQIIAAQAGEQGRAFSVVAHEVRKLATQTASYASEIGELVLRVREAAELTVNSVSRGSSSIQSGARRSNEAQQVLEGICKLARSSQQMGKEIDSSTKEQDESVRSVSGSMSQIGDMVAQINTAIAEQERACNEIQRSAEGMRMMGDAVISATNEQRASRDQLAGAVDRVGARSEQILAANRIQRDDRKTIIQALAVFRTSADSGAEHVRDLNRIAVGLSRQAESLESERVAAADPSIADSSATDDR